MRRFEGQRVVVTGAASGIGHEATRLFLEEGANVVGADIAPSGVPQGALALKVDVSSPPDMRSLVAAAIDELSGIDVLFNNAGVGSTTDVITATPEEWDQVFAVNVRGVFLGMKYAIPHMLDQGHGAIVNTASAAGMIGLPDRAAYCASKGAVISLTQQVAVQWAASGIRCNAVCPGTVDSPWVTRLVAAADDSVAYRAQLVARQPIGRLAQPSEIAKAVLYLASDDAAFVTGTCLVIDGGITAG